MSDIEHQSDLYMDDFPYPHLDPPELADGGDVEPINLDEVPF